MVTGQVEGGLDKGWICSILGRFYFQKLLKFLFKHSLKYSSPLLLEKLALLPVQAGLSHWIRPSCPVIFFFERSGCLSSTAPTRRQRALSSTSKHITMETVLRNLSTKGHECFCLSGILGSGMNGHRGRTESPIAPYLPMLSEEHTCSCHFTYMAFSFSFCLCDF